jgi:predicted DNA repair protein MutK
VAGGIYLCFEGFEKVSHKLLHSGEDSGGEHETLLAAVADETVDLVAHEQAKIRGAIRTDLVLSAEIVVITLGIVASEPLLVRLGVLSVVAAMITVGVYGLIAGIVKLDDAGRYLLGGRLDLLGRALLRTAPWLMKALSVAGTAAMFLVGGGIIAHTVPWLHHLIEHATAGLAEDGWARALAPTATSAAVGLATGAAAVACAGLAGRLRHALASAGEGGPT